MKNILSTKEDKFLDDVLNNDKKNFKNEEEELIKFGVITDVQYANVDDQVAWYDENKFRFYRGSFLHLEKAFGYWNNLEIKPNFVLQLGDLIDGLNKKDPNINPIDILKKTLKFFEQFPKIPTFHAVGNHEFYNFSRFEIATYLKNSLKYDDCLNFNSNEINLNSQDLEDESLLFYYKFSPKKNFKVIALDCFDISIIGQKLGNEKYNEAEKILLEVHGKDDLDLWDYGSHLSGLNKRFLLQNGGIGLKQLEWLEKELLESEQKNEKVIIFGHVCLHPDSCDPSCLVYNYEKVIDIFNKFNCVICYLSGHAHKNGYAIENGIHYIVFHGVIETDPKEDAFTTITIKKDLLIVEGRGSEQCYVLPLDFKNGVPSDQQIPVQNIENGLYSSEIPIQEEEDQLTNVSMVQVIA